MIAKALGWKSTDLPAMEPIMTGWTEIALWVAARGKRRGREHDGAGIRTKECKIDMIHPTQFEPELGGRTGRFITLGAPPPVICISRGDGGIAPSRCA
jgi:hypothetical protein